MTCLGLDIGGANLKAADGAGWAKSVPFPLWQRPNELTAVLRALLAEAPPCEELAVTMTGELCDCFRTKADGVHHILQAVDEATGGGKVRVYLVGGRFVATATARELPRAAAASNWHALAKFACRFTRSRPALLVDIGSTTTDLIPMNGGKVCAAGATDVERLMSGELVYTGVGRTPICAVTTWVPWRDGRCPVAAELFATTADAYVVLGNLKESHDACWTADGRPLTRPFARERLARMICADATLFDDSDALRAAEAIRNAQLALLRGQLTTVMAAQSAPPKLCIVCGSGEFLARRLVEEIGSDFKIISMAEALGLVVSTCAAAHAVAVLAQEAGEA